MASEASRESPDFKTAPCPPMSGGLDLMAGWNQYAPPAAPGPKESDTNVPSCSQQVPDDVPEGGVVSDLRIIADPWSEPVARRVLGFLASQKLGSRMSDIRVDPLPTEGQGRSMQWVCFAPQDEVDNWRFSSNYAGAALLAVGRWLKGDFISFGNALAICFPLPLLLEGLLECLEARKKAVLRKRMTGSTLESLGTVEGVTRERIRQIENSAARELGARIIALKAVHHPAALALFSHVNRLAADVLIVASREDGVLLESTRGRWIQAALSTEDAEALQIFQRISNEMDEEFRPIFDPHASIGSHFQGGRTALPWSDDDVAALKAGFAVAVGDRKRRWASLQKVCAAAKLEAGAVSALAKFATLTVHDDWVFEGRLKAADILRTTLTGILSSADRAMHVAELLEEVISLGFGADSALRDIHRAMAEDHDTFASDGYALWQLRGQLVSEVKDGRPEHPALPSPPSPSDLTVALAALAQLDRSRPSEKLAGLSASASDFAIQAGHRLATALAQLPTTERRSLAQVLHPLDEVKLIAWLKIATPRDSYSEPPSSDWSTRVLEGLTLLAAFAATVRTECGSDDSVWPAILGACGEPARAWIFNSQAALRQHVMSRLVEVSTVLKLRRAFSFQSDPWSTLVTLQAGMLHKDISVLPRWLSASQPPVAVRQLVAPGLNHSTSMACIWNALQAYRRGHIRRDAIDTLSQHSDWWPGWSPDDACRACTASVFDGERPPRNAGHEMVTPQKDLVPGDASSGDTSAVPQPSFIEPPDPNAPFGASDVALDTDGDCFVVALPEWLNVPPGPVTLLGDGFRIGGVVQERGTVHWHTEVRRIRIRLRGPPERTLRLERGHETIASYPVRLWAIDDYIAVFPLGTGRGRALDPFLSPLPRTGGLALLLHRTLTVSVPADDEHQLDGQYVLQVFRSGLPSGATVSCEGEILWEAEQQAEPRRVDPGLTADLDLDRTSARWGGRADLLLPHPPAGFVPYKAYIGAQALLARRDGDAWRFPDFALLPGLDALRRRGRIDGFLNGERVTVRAVVSLAHAPIGAAIRDGDGWKPFDPSASFEITRYGQTRLWACLPSLVDDLEWTVFEGPRPVIAYRDQGVRLGHYLFGFGEPLSVEPRRFNRNNSGVPLAKLVVDAGVIAGGERVGDSLHLRFTTPLGWTDRHKALAWSVNGIVELPVVAGSEPSASMVLAVGDHGVDGVCIYHGTGWLGTGILSDDPAAATTAFLAEAPGWPDTLRLAVSGKLPLLAEEAAAKVAKRMQTDGGKGLDVLCRAAVTTASGHVLGRLLETWKPGRQLSEALVEQFVRVSGDGTGQITLLNKLTAEAPCATVRVLAQGLQIVPRSDRLKVIEKLTQQLLRTEDERGGSGTTGAGLVASAEMALLEKATQVTGFDRNFLASKVDASIASIAWAAASTPEPSRHDPNLSTCLTVMPVRRWLSVHLLARLATHVR